MSRTRPPPCTHTPGPHLAALSARHDRAPTRRAPWPGHGSPTHPAVGGPGGKQYLLSREAGGSVATQMSRGRLPGEDVLEMGVCTYVSRGKDHQVLSMGPALTPLRGWSQLIHCGMANWLLEFQRALVLGANSGCPQPCLVPRRWASHCEVPGLSQGPATKAPRQGPAGTCGPPLVSAVGSDAKTHPHPTPVRTNCPPEKSRGPSLPPGLASPHSVAGFLGCALISIRVCFSLPRKCGDGMRKRSHCDEGRVCVGTCG